MDNKKRNIIIQFIKENETVIQFLRFNIVGILNTVITYIIYAVLVFSGAHYRVALISEYAFGTVFSFILNKIYTFNYNERASMYLFGKMVLTYVVIFFANLGILDFCIKTLHMNEYLGQLLTLMLIVLLSFVFQKLFVFRKRNSNS